MTGEASRMTQPNPLTEADLAEIEAEVRRLRARILEGGEVER